MKGRGKKSKTTSMNTIANLNSRKAVRCFGDAPREVKVRHIGNCLKADPAYGKGIPSALGIPLSRVPK